MTPRGGGRAVLVAALVLVALVAPAVAGGWPAAAQEVDSEPVDLGRYRGPVRLEAGPRTTFELGDGRRLVGTVEVRANAGGPVLVNELGIERYVAGIAEMPASWPLEALKAQAVAARTYAWWQAQRDSYDGYDICATVACQVFVGAERVETPVVGARWQQAVEATAGQVLMHDGGPILARYFSTSGGRTHDNAAIFPETGDLPYLQGVEDPDDAVSPFHRWTATFTREQFDAVLGRGDTLSAAVPVEQVERIQGSGGDPDQVRVTGADGATATVTAGDLREFVSDVAPELFPDAFPGPRADGDGRLPATLPSSRFEVEVETDEVVVSGRGWGHGVGMGQYGALGKAQRGLTHDQILAAYYNGLGPRTPPDLPARVRVGLPMGGDAATVRADGPFTVVVGDDVIAERGLGAWTVTAADDGTLALTGPPGFGAPLVVAPTEASRDEVGPVEVVALETVVNKASQLALEVARDGEVVLRRDLGVVDPGRQVALWSLDDDAGEGVAPGAYRVRLSARDETGATAGDATQVRVRAATATSRTPTSALGPPPEGAGRPSGILVLAVGLGAVVGAVIGRVLRP